MYTYIESCIHLSCVDEKKTEKSFNNIKFSTVNTMRFYVVDGKTIYTLHIVWGFNRKSCGQILNNTD